MHCRAPIRGFLLRPTIHTMTTHTMAHGHPAPTPLGSYLLPILLANVRYTPSTSRSGTRTPERSLYIEEINQNGFLRRFDPEYFFHKLTGDQHQANQMSDYWRSHYGLPLKHGGTPFQPTWTSSTPTPAAAQQLAGLLFGNQAAAQLTSSTATSSDSLLALTDLGTAATNNMS